jgi:hypothetical protein
MKTKLLKKIRKRFSITHYPKGITLFGEYYNHDIFRLSDSEDSYYDRYCELKQAKDAQRFCDIHGETEEECVDILKTCIIKKLNREYLSLGSKCNTRIQTKKVWYNNEI